MDIVRKSLALTLILVINISSLIIVASTSAQSITKPSVPQFTVKPVTPTTINITIKNQPFTPYIINGSEVNVYYQVQYKGYYAATWQFYSNSKSITPIQLTYYNTQSNTDFTVISVLIDFPKVGGYDFQVRALIGYITVTNYGVSGYTDWLAFHGETSDWSNTQTITIPSTSTSTSPTPTVPEFPILTIVPLLITILSVAVIIKNRSRKFD